MRCLRGGEEAESWGRVEKSGARVRGGEAAGVPPGHGWGAAGRRGWGGRADGALPGLPAPSRSCPHPAPVLSAAGRAPAFIHPQSAKAGDEAIPWNEIRQSLPAVPRAGERQTGSISPRCLAELWPSSGRGAALQADTHCLRPCAGSSAQALRELVCLCLEIGSLTARLAPCSL